MQIYESSFLMTLLQSTYPGGMWAFTESGGIVAALPAAGKIAIYHPELNDEFKKTILSACKSRRTGVVFFESRNFAWSTEDEIFDFRRELAGFLVKQELLSSRVTTNDLVVIVELLDVRSKARVVKELCGHLAADERISNLIVTCKDRSIASRSIAGSIETEYRKEHVDMLALESFLNLHGE